MELHQDLLDWLFEQCYADEDQCLSELIETGSCTFETPAGFKFVAVLKFEKA